MADKYEGTESNIASKRLLDECGVKYTKFKAKNYSNLNILLS